MTNETTASQPKSIGDDAQFLALFREYTHVSELIRGHAKRPWADLVSYIDSRAPAAQASATIQAAPEGYILAKQTVVEMPNGKKVLGYTLLDGVGIFTSHEEVSKAISTLSLPLGWVSMTTAQLLPGWQIPEAATIQEPVMVTEPVDVKYEYRARHENGMLMDWAPLDVDTDAEANAYGHQWRKVAAPMVADPAGVVVDIDKMIASGPIGVPEAATVKAVPSEALRVPIENKAVDPHVPAMVRMTTKTFNPANNSVIFKCHHCKREERHDQAKVGADQWFICEGKDFFLLSGRDKFVDYAPLADKTGGGE